MKTHITRSTIYAERNTKAAEIIAANPERYGGERSLMVLWARAILGPARGLLTIPPFERIFSAKDPE